MHSNSASPYKNAFAGISGSATPAGHSPGPSDGVRGVNLPDGALLLDPAGRWALRLHNLRADNARLLLQVLRDLAPVATGIEASCIRRVASYDEACQTDPSLSRHVEEGALRLDGLARKLTGRRYVEIEERSMRRTLLTQLADLPLMDRLGVRTPAYASATV